MLFSRIMTLFAKPMDDDPWWDEPYQENQEKTSEREDRETEEESAVIHINGKTYRGKNLEVKGNQVYIDGKKIDHEDQTSGTILQVKIEGMLEHLTADGDVHCGDVSGSVQAGDTVHCGNVGGSVQAGDSVHCKDIQGSCIAGDSIIRSSL